MKPTNRQEPYKGVVGGQVAAEEAAGFVDDGCIAFPERVREAARQWPQADVNDFEKISKRAFVDRGSGIEYRSVPGAVLLDVGGEANRGISCFIIEGGRLVFLRRADFPVELSVAHGHVYSQQLTPENPGPELRIH